MGANADLYEIEDTLKKKYIDMVKNMSRLELKKFSAGEYQKLVLAELTKSLPRIDGTKLKETAECISNALEREVKSQLRNGARESAASQQTSTLLSDTVIADFETTLGVDTTQTPADPEQFSCEESDDDAAEHDVSDDDENPNDSVTRLKQLASSTTKTSDSNCDHQQLCIEQCKIKPNSKKHYDMTRCSFVLSGFTINVSDLVKMSQLGFGCVLPVDTFPDLYEMTSSI